MGILHAVRRHCEPRRGLLHKNNEELFSSSPAPYLRGQDRFKQFPTPGTEEITWNCDRAEMHQHAIQQALHGWEGVRDISDDIILHAKDDQQHDEREVIRKIASREVKFRMAQLEFIGYLLSTRSIGPTESKFEAVINAREPESVAEVRSFLGLSAKFIPNLATVADHLDSWHGKAWRSNAAKSNKKRSRLWNY